MHFFKKTRILSYLIYTIIFFVTIPLLIDTVSFKRDSPTIKNISYVNEMDVRIDHGAWKATPLPHTFTNLPPGTPLTFKTTVTPGRDDSIYIASNYAHANVYFDDQLVFTFGKKENYPHFMMTSAKEIHVIETYGDNSPIELKIEYISPDCSSSLSVEPPMIGTAKELILERSVKYGLSFMFSLSQIISGLSLICISFYFIFIDKKGILFTWLGIFALASGLWFFGSNNLAITIFPNSAWLYISSYIGLAFCLMPLWRMLIHAVNFENIKPMIIMENVYGSIVVISVFLQLFKIIPLHISLYFFKLLIPVYLFILTACIIYERVKWKNKYAGRFILPMLILYLSASIEIINQFFLNPGSHATLLFQIGIFIFLLMMGIIAGISMKDSLNLKKREEALAQKQNMIDIMTEEQRARSLSLAENETNISRQRHDLRHHISAIMELSEGNEKLQEYLSTLMAKIPSKRERYCENDIVNAIISHYASLCESNSITLKTKLNVPIQSDASLNSDFCVIFANLLENAFEACNRIDTDIEKVIDLKSSFNGKILTITMDNTFNGNVTVIGERYRSSKRNDFGIGLTSVQSIAKKYHGDAVFSHDQQLFFSSVYLSI